MESHKIEISTKITHLDKFHRLKNTYQYPFNHDNDDILTLTKYDDNNTEIESVSLPVRSFVQAFGKQLNLAFSGHVSTIEKSDGSGNVTASYDTGDIFNTNAQSGTGSFGVIVGAGSASVTFSDSLIPSIFQHGSGVNQLLYGITSFASASVVGTGSYKIGVSRKFTNYSGNNIIIRETGIVSKNNVGEPFLLLRDRIDKSSADINFTLNNGQTINVAYSFYVDDRGYLNQNWLKLLYSELSQQAQSFQTTTFDSVGAKLLQAASASNIAIQAPAQIDTWGIVVGSGSGSYNQLTAYRLLGQMQHGSASNQLMYSASTGSVLISTVGSGVISFNRSFTNQSPTSSVIHEVGLYVHGDSRSGGNFLNTQTNNKICILRVPITQVTLDIEDILLVQYLLTLKAVN